MTTTKTNNPQLQQLKAVQQDVENVLTLIGRMGRTGSTSSLLRAAELPAQYPPLLVVASNAQFSDLAEAYKGTMVSIEALGRVSGLAGRQFRLFFDNHAIATLLGRVNQAIDDVMRKEKATATQREEEHRERLTLAAATVIELTRALKARDEKLELAIDHIDLLTEQVQVLTRALGDAQSKITELTAR